MFLTPGETGGLAIFSLRQCNRYLAVEPCASGRIYEFDIRDLAQALGQDAGETWQEHERLILLACIDGKLFEWLDKIGGE